MTHLRWIWRGLLVLCLLCTGCIRTGQAITQPPAYPQSERLSLDTTTFEAQRSLIFRTLDPPETIFRFYDHQMVQQGWERGNTSANYHDYGCWGKGGQFALTVRILKREAGYTYGLLQFTFVGPGVVFPPDYAFPPAFQ